MRLPWLSKLRLLRALCLPALAGMLACSGGGGGGGFIPDAAAGTGAGGFGAFGGQGGGGGGQAGTAGSAGGSSCPGAQLFCDGQCVDGATDPSHCGSCQKACESNQICSGGACVAPPDECPPTGCPFGSYCDLTTNKCVAGCLDDTGCNLLQRCENRLCVACTSGLGNCDLAALDGCETNLTADNQNCGSCGKACPAGRTCAGGTCQCAGGTTDCGGNCVDTQSDKANCGGCNTTCTPPANSTTACVSGTCKTNCNSGYHLCGSTCAKNDSTATCGSSCTPCVPPANATATCDGTSCDFTCNAGYVRSGSSCVQHCSTTGCTGFNWCDTATGLCTAGCTKHTQCSSGQYCNINDHTCYVTVNSNCPTGYVYKGTCSNGKQFCVHGGLPSGTVYKFVDPCPVGTVERGSWYCSDVTRVCVPDL